MEFAKGVFFIEIFLPVSLIIYYIFGFIRKENVRSNARNILLLVLSIVFYAWGGLYQLLLFIGMMAVNYLAGIFMEKLETGFEEGARKIVLVCAVFINVLLLVVFKYFNMMVTLIEILTSGEKIGGIFSSLLKFECTGALGIKAIAMPLAISFITFQSISYIADVYTRKVKPCKNPAHFALYMSFFAQLTQGPIMRYGDLGPQITNRTHSAERFMHGIKRFCYGLGKKVLIANIVAREVDRIWAIENLDAMGSGIAWLGLVLYTLQIYYDFSGYTDMAIGVGLMFGFDITENFNYPYTSFSIQEFWRRWHMSLSFWFRDYIYIPLGGSRCKKSRIYFNLFMVFLLTGIWHGANLTFILWGLLFALFSIIERAFLGNLLKKNPVKIVNWIYTQFVVMMGWVLFRAPNLDAAGRYFRQLFSFKASSAGLTVLSYLDMEILVALIAGILLTGILQRPLMKLYDKVKYNYVFMSADTIAQIAIFVWSLIMLVGGSYNPSIYGNF